MISSEEKAFELDVYTPTGHALHTDARSVVFPAVDGEVGILADHTPLVAMVGSGRLVAQAPDGANRVFFVAGGFVQVRENVVTILAEDCCAVEDLDFDTAWNGLEQARRLPAETEREMESRQQAIETARIRFNMAQAARRRKMKGQQ